MGILTIRKIETVLEVISQTPCGDHFTPFGSDRTFGLLRSNIFMFELRRTVPPKRMVTTHSRRRTCGRFARLCEANLLIDFATAEQGRNEPAKQNVPTKLKHVSI